MRPIRISGMMCNLAGGTRSPDGLWYTLWAQSCHITYSPPSRWQQACKPARVPTAVLVGGFLSSELQAVLMQSCGGFPAAEAAQLDIHVQLLLDTSVEALVDAGLEQTRLQTKATGVFTSSQPSDFIIPLAGHNVARALASVLRTSGPHQNSDFACSSGYLTTHHAIQALDAGHCPAGAVVAGVSLLLKPPPGWPRRWKPAGRPPSRCHVMWTCGYRSWPVGSVRTDPEGSRRAFRRALE